MFQKNLTIKDANANNLIQKKSSSLVNKIAFERLSKTKRSYLTERRLSSTRFISEQNLSLLQQLPDQSSINPTSKVVLRKKATLGSYISNLEGKEPNTLLCFSPAVRKTLKMFGHPLRLQLLLLFKESHQTVSNLVTLTDQERYFVNNQVMVLYKNKILSRYKKNKTLHYFLSETNYLEFLSLFSGKAKFDEVADVLKLISHPLPLYILQKTKDESYTRKQLNQMIQEEFYFVEKVNQPFSYCFVNKMFKLLLVSGILNYDFSKNSTAKHLRLANKEVSLIVESLGEHIPEYQKSLKAIPLFSYPFPTWVTKPLSYC